MPTSQSKQKQSIHDILGFFREQAKNNRDLGDKFERLIVAYLRKEPYFAEHYSDVWLWSEWPQRGKKPDTGIDIVAKERATGDFCAIQCKFFDPDYQLQKADIDSFFTASGKEPFKQRLIVSTTDKWSKHAEDACKNQQVPVNRLRVLDLDESPIDWSEFKPDRPQAIKLTAKKKLRPHQVDALNAVVNGFKLADRGKLIMACGTGKTFTALKIAEKFVPSGGTVLFLVPSISLISQTVTEWCAEAETPLSSFAVCSDPKAGKRHEQEDISSHDLAFPAHTNPRRLADDARALKSIRKSNITVIFSTYQSIAVVSEAQRKGLPDIDLVICDEAHRTTGVEKLELDEKDASAFVAIHKSGFIKARKRLYMTATPRIYDDASKAKAREADIKTYSMDNVEDYGEEFYRLDFSEAVRKDLLSDYKVMVLAVDEKYVSKAFQSQLTDKNKELAFDDVVKIVGCYNGLKKKTIPVDGDGSDALGSSPMRRAVAFSRSIKDSRRVTELFSGIITDYQSSIDNEIAGNVNADFLRCEVEHVDGTFNALVRNTKLQWLKADTGSEGNICRILSNVRCLSEGVDVPALDAVMFLNPRNSVVDVVQSVGRVMRKAEGKQYGYIILPIGIPADVSPEVALADNQKYKVVWQVLQALRAHDDRFNAIINQIELNDARTDKIQIIGVGEPTQDGNTSTNLAVQTAFNFPHLQDWENAIFAKIVVKCGSRRYWEDWAKDVAKIAERHITRIKALLESSDEEYRKKFATFLKGLRKTLNPSISEDDAIEMLSQHLVTKPVFDALFEGYEFTKSNPVSKTMQRMLDLLEKQNFETETAPLERFYESVRERARGIDNAEGKQKIIVELYDKFFKAAFPRMVERLGIVYTPVEVVDFILHSADDALKSEFGVGLTNKDVHILDPFTGTGTFVVRLLQSGIIQDKDLKRKYNDELHANEIVLLAYYIAAINIEEAFHGRAKSDYQPFDGIVLADTFQLSEGMDSFEDPVFPANSERARKQNKQDIRVIVSNPPYSAWQQSANDSNQNLKYPRLDNRIKQSYAAFTQSSNKSSLYDSYIRSIRWASDRIGDSGIICYVSNGSFIDSNATDGLRKCLSEEFTSIYVFNLRGNQRTSGETSRQEGGKVFGAGSRAAIAITLFVKNSAKQSPATIKYYDIGDYLSREKKLEIIRTFGSAHEIPWKTIEPNKNHDWINQRDEAFGRFMPLGERSEKGNQAIESVFVSYSTGVQTNRDAWVYNSSKVNLVKDIERFIAFYQKQLKEFRVIAAKGKVTDLDVENFIDNDPKKIKWSSSLKDHLKRIGSIEYDPISVKEALYRPFVKQNLYYGDKLIHRPGAFKKYFPDGADNRVICVTGVGATNDFSVLITREIPDLEMISKSQCYPLRIFATEDGPDELFGRGDLASNAQSNISKFALARFKQVYRDEKITTDDIFHYVYGLLHSDEYKRRFGSDLVKMLPRIPFAREFWAFRNAGFKLAEIHLNYEKAKPYAVKEHKVELELDNKHLYEVQKMRFGKKGKDVDKTVIQYNSHLTVTGIPLEAYKYVVNGKPAIEWIMERYQNRTDPDTNISNDPNDWGRDHDNPKYIVNLLKSIITVSLETNKIVNSLPPLQELE